jgi:hypothetical protein
VIRPNRPKLPLFAIGSGVVHAIGIAILLPLLITLPGTGGDKRQRPVNIEVEVSAKSPPRPVVPDVSSLHPAADDATSALPATDSGALADIRPDASSGEARKAAVPRDKPVVSVASAKKVKSKPKVEAKGIKPAAKAARAPQPKKSLLARAKPGKPLFKGTGARVKAPAQGSWTSLFNASPSAADAR